MKMFYQKKYNDLKSVIASYEKDEDGGVIKSILHLDSSDGERDVLTLNFPLLPVFVSEGSIVEWDKFKKRLVDTKVIYVWVFKQDQLFHISIYFYDGKIVLISCKDIPELHEQFN